MPRQTPFTRPASSTAVRRKTRKQRHAGAPPAVSLFPSYLLESSQHLIFRMGRNMRINYGNPLITRYFACDMEELKSRHVNSTSIPAATTAFIATHARTVFRTRDRVNITATLPMANGDITGEFIFLPELAPNGAVDAVVCRMVDITTKIQVEQELNLAEKRVAALHRLTRMYEASVEETLRFALEEIRLMTASEHSYIFLPQFGLDGKDRMAWSDSLHKAFDGSPLPDDRLPESCVPLEQLGKPKLSSQITNSDGEKAARISLGRLPIYRGMFVPIVDEGQLVAVVAVCNKSSDYSASDLRQMELFANGIWLLLRRHQYMDKLKRAKEHAERANKVKDEFLANISHELRTPLNGMLSMLQLLGLSGLTCEQNTYTQNALLSGQSLLRIISDILDFSSLESGKMGINQHPFDPRATISSTLSLFAVEAEKRGINLGMDIDASLPPLLLGDEARIRQILFNLVGNAIKFTDQGIVNISCSRLPQSGKEKIRLYLAVSDTGIGIAEEFHNIIFDPFTQIDGSHSRRHAGTGLGLGIVHRLTQNMGGSITVESAPGRGTTFHCSIPFETAPPLTRVEEPHDQTAHPLSRLDILVAEDDPVNQFAIRTFLLRTGHRIVCVNDGRQALEALRLHPFNCLITDIQMPEIDGLEVARRIRGRHTEDIIPSPQVRELMRHALHMKDGTLIQVSPDLPIIALTAHAMSGDKERFLNSGMDMYMSKPISVPELSKILLAVYERVKRAEN